MGEDQHVYHHNDPAPTFSVKAERNTKGWNYEASVNGAQSVEDALTLLKELTTRLENQYGRLNQPQP